MARRVLGTLFVIAVAAELMSSGARAQTARDALPHNLEVHPALQVFVDRMWERSPTFRRQCRRLAAERQVRLHLLPLDLAADRLHGLGVHFHAKSFLTYDGGALVSARIHVSRSQDGIEQIAHELEHVVEQLDGVRLQGRASSAVAWKTDDGSYETRRAIEVGRRVAWESGLVCVMRRPVTRAAPCRHCFSAIATPGHHRDPPPG